MEDFSILGQPAHDNVKKSVGIPNCLTIASTFFKNCFQYAGVPFTELINKKRYH